MEQGKERLDRERVVLAQPHAGVERTSRRFGYDGCQAEVGVVVAELLAAAYLGAERLGVLLSLLIAVQLAVVHRCVSALALVHAEVPLRLQVTARVDPLLDVIEKRVVFRSRGECVIHLGARGDLGHFVLVLRTETYEGAFLLRSEVASCGETLARGISQTENIDLHVLQVLVECLVHGQHLDMLVVKFEFGHGVDRVHRVLLHSKLINLLRDNIAFPIRLRLNLHLLSSILLLDILIIHDIVQVSVNLGIGGVLKNGADAALDVVDKEELALAIARIPALEEHGQVAFDRFELFVADEAHVEAQVGALLENVVSVVRREVLHPGDVARRALEVEVDREVGKALKDSKDGILVDLHVVLLHLLRGVHQNLYDLSVLDGLCDLEGRKDLGEGVELRTAVEVCQYLHCVDVSQPDREDQRAVAALVDLILVHEYRAFLFARDQSGNHGQVTLEDGSVEREYLALGAIKGLASAEE